MSAAILLDTDNIRFSYMNHYELEPDFLRIRKLAFTGSVEVSRAYMDTERHPHRIRVALESSGFDITYTPTKMSVKGAISQADSYIIMDAIELVYEKPEIDTIVLCTGDGDFAKLISKLIHRYQKTVKIIAVKGSISNQLRQTPAELIQLGEDNV